MAEIDESRGVRAVNKFDPGLVATDILYRESACLDGRKWQEWLDLYTENAVYWVPSWRDEDEPTSSADTEVSQIYHDSRRGLEERVKRVESGKSVTAMPLARTTHFITNITAVSENPDTISARANWMVQFFQPHRGQQYSNFGDYQLTLKWNGSQWKIAAKTIVLKNDLVPALLDFYLL